MGKREFGSERKERELFGALPSRPLARSAGGQKLVATSKSKDPNRQRSYIDGLKPQLPRLFARP